MFQLLPRLLMVVGLLQVFGSFSTQAFAQTLAQSPMIFDVRKSLPLEPDEPVFHDFYINAGNEAGLRKGMYATVVRLVPVHDPVQNKQQGTLQIGIAELLVIHVERYITVARLVTEYSDEERPTVEFEAVMIGDRVDLASLTTEGPKKPAAKKKTADAGVPAAPSAAAQTAQAPSVQQVPAPAAPAVVPENQQPAKNEAEKPRPSLPAATATTQVEVPAATTTYETYADATEQEEPGTSYEEPAAPSSQARRSASPSSPAADIVRVPVPPATQTL